MKRLRLFLIAGFVAILLAGVVFIGAGVHFALHVPEAYAAWDAGDLLIAYMKANDDRWPGSWDELDGWAHSLPDRPNNRLNDPGSLQRIRELIRIDYSFNPRAPGNATPVRPLDGDAFAYVWQGAEPNEMIREYLQRRPPSTSSVR
jgi:hypothetical protein